MVGEFRPPEPIVGTDGAGPQGPLRWLGAAFDRLIALLNAIGTAGIFLLMILINADVIRRGLVNAPIRGVEEIVSLTIVAIVFLQAGHTLATGRLTRSDAFFDVLKRRHPRLAGGLGALFDLTGAALFATLFWASYPLLTRAWRDDLFVGALGDFTAPIWPVKLVVLIGSAALTAQFLIFAGRGLAALLGLRRPARETP
jgi:TRAP-type mannitol/chloroaromatic compound transport system permease small subunit